MIQNGRIIFPQMIYIIPYASDTEWEDYFYSYALNHNTSDTEWEDYFYSYALNHTTSDTEWEDYLSSLNHGLIILQNGRIFFTPML